MVSLPATVADADAVVLAAEQALARAEARVSELEAEVAKLRREQADAVQRGGEALAGGSDAVDAAAIGQDVVALGARAQVLEAAILKAGALASSARDVVRAAVARREHVRLHDAALALEVQNLRFAHVVARADGLYGEWAEAQRTYDEAVGRAAADVDWLGRHDGVTYSVPGLRVPPPGGMGQVVEFWRQHSLPEYREALGRLADSGDLAAIRERAGLDATGLPLPRPPGPTSVPATVVARARRLLGAVA